MLLWHGPCLAHHYREAVQRFPLAGPTLFAGVINVAAAQAAKPTPQQLRYHALMIMTDGMVMDLHDTIKSIVGCSSFCALLPTNGDPAHPVVFLLACAPLLRTVLAAFTIGRRPHAAIDNALTKGWHWAAA